jgi:hypothetical protein
LEAALTVVTQDAFCADQLVTAARWGRKLRKCRVFQSPVSRTVNTTAVKLEIVKIIEIQIVYKKTAFSFSQDGLFSICV